MNINLTLIAQMIAFGLFVWFCMTYVWPPIVTALQQRKDKIAEGLAAAERGQRERELGEQRALTLMKDAKADGAEIVNQAQRRAAEIVDQAKQDARVEGDRLVAAAQAEIEQEVNRAREELRERIGQLAVSAAEKILEKEINPAAHKALIDSFSQQL
ncbi:ATP synthase, F0 subunit b [Thioflavicoccus mobilis 8321]|uniref:ATP synthase subunit b n=1 Tax=Thioflavicoccus mobilis 8321 TaxID=765912 RepID=L0GVX9_9GAMM|nr:F0F1 ATP synthase subunit B [Thioflavicoccus mobilis]AGA89967.1 ATP synthase, F0 subunit b [Thioflavicoccus mobilis 8321]